MDARDPAKVLVRVRVPPGVPIFQGLVLNGSTRLLGSCSAGSNPASLTSIWACGLMVEYLRDMEKVEVRFLSCPPVFHKYDRLEAGP